MVSVLNEILSINLNDGVKFDIVSITDIREEDEYGGNKYHITGRVNSTKVNLEIDISTGDKATPKELKFKYPLLFEEFDLLLDYLHSYCSWNKISNLFLFYHYQ